MAFWSLAGEPTCTVHGLDTTSATATGVDAAGRGLVVVVERGLKARTYEHERAMRTARAMRPTRRIQRP